MSKNQQIVIQCYHCGNTTPHCVSYRHTTKMLFEQIDDQKYYEDYEFVSCICSTCGGLNLFGDFTEYPQNEDFSKKRLYPMGSSILPPRHKLHGENPIPVKILKMYDEIWPLRLSAPNAFVTQVRRALELICQDKGASGKNLYQMLEDLVRKEVFPGYFSEITGILREVGNIAAHASEQEIDLWDAELIDDFFRFVIDYVYIAPSKIERMRQRLQIGSNKKSD